jgi:protease IV
MRRIFVGLLAVIGAISLLSMVGLIAGLWWAFGAFLEEDPLPESFVLALEISDEIPEASPNDAIAAFWPAQAELGLVDLVDAIDQAAGDERVKGLVADLSGAAPGFAQTQELRAAVFRFRATGKTAVAFADSFESGAGGYYLASAFDQIWMQPSGLLGLTGLSMELPLARGLMDKIGLLPEFESRYEYKGAMSFLTDREFPPALRENYTRIAESLYAQMVSGIASARRMSGNNVSDVIDGGPLLAGEAANNGLIDGLGYAREAEWLATGGTLETVGAGQYLASAGHPHAEGVRIALLHLDGQIDRGDDGPLERQRFAGSVNFDRAVDEILEDDEVRAVILRISSPGGSFVASDTMRRAVLRLREADLPVIASFGDMAASGGYYAALPATHVLAHPGTLTGSIGAVGGKISGAGLLDEMDVAIGRVEIGDNAGIYSVTRPFTQSQSLRMKRILDSIYDDFTTKVGTARNLNQDEVDALARGRVWTGEDARRVGLVDGLGGYSEALQLARQSIGIAPDAPVERVRFPRDDYDTEALLGALADGDIMSAVLSLGEVARMAAVILETQRLGTGPLIQAEAPHMRIR